MNFSRTAAYWIEKLELNTHPEGGYYKETYRSSDLVSMSGASGENGFRAAGTAIYYLLEKEDFSAFHKLASDEIYHFYDGGVLKLWMLGTSGELSEKMLGPAPEKNQSFQITIPKGSWFASEVIEGDYCLAGCTVAPGFEFQDFELADASELARAFPAYSELIQRMSSKKRSRGPA